MHQTLLSRDWGFVPNDIRLSELKVGAVINTSSGGCDLESEAKMLSILRNAGVVEPKAWSGQGEEMDGLFAKAAAQRLDILIVLGGDGTIRRAADARPEISPYLIAFPGER